MKQMSLPIEDQTQRPSGDDEQRPPEEGDDS